MNTSLARNYREADRIMGGVAWLLCVLSLALATWYGTWGLALTVGISLALASTAGVVLLPARRATRILNAVVLMTFSALLIQQSHGMIEMHFTIFVLLAFLLYYRDWLPLVLGAALAAAHHLGFYVLQANGVPVFLFNHPANISMVFIHAAFVVFETALLVYMATQSKREALDAEEVSALGSRTGEDGRIDLCIAKGSATGISAKRIEDFLLTIGIAVAGARDASAGVHSASVSLSEVNEQIRVNAEETSSQANLVSDGANDVSQNIGAVAAGTEQMQSSMRAILGSANEAARIAKIAVEVARNTNQIVGKLGTSSSEIGEFVKVIASIAQQTNLLALNATIEAARAGDAGKGFAVVAGEVKELAKATAKATEEIGKKIETIQGNTEAAVAAIGEISAVIGQVNDISSTIASAVEEQTTTTNEIGRNVEKASQFASEIAGNISDVAKAAQNTASLVNNAQEASRTLAETASTLETLVGRFKVPQLSRIAENTRITIPVRAAAAGL